MATLASMVVQQWRLVAIGGDRQTCPGQLCPFVCAVDSGLEFAA